MAPIPCIAECQGPTRSAFTLIEVLVVITVIAALIGLLLPAIAMVRQRSALAATRATVSSVAMALEVYRQEDRRQYFPLVEAGGGLTRTPAGVLPKGVLSLLAGSGFDAGNDALSTEPDGSRRLIDAWQRPIRYHCDATVNGVVDRPAPLADWNPKDAEPWAYVWSIGPIRKGDVADALPANAAGHWIYRSGGR